MITPSSTVAEKQLCHTVLELIAAELEVEPQELYNDHTEFEELGLDRNLASFTVRKIKQKAGIQLSEGVFDDCPDVGLFKTHLVQEARRLATPAVSEPQAPPPAQKPGTTSNGDKTKPPAPLSVLIRGRRTSPDNANLFLLPDGSGSAMCYARIPPLSQAHNLWALNSPFLGRGRSVEGFTIQALASTWTEEILSIQPPGRGRAYALGGWSAGGYYAFEVARQLRARGLVVDRLVLIDSPSRTRFEAMPLAVVEYLSRHSLMGQGGEQAKPAPAWLVDHFAATLEAVEAYVPDAMGPPPESNSAACGGSGGGDGGQATLPRVFIIWAEDALLSPEEARRTGLDLKIHVSRFLLESRSEEDYGPGGWESLFPPGTPISVATMPGHHFNIVHQPHENRWRTVDILEEL
ncbi:putative secondary metabolism biosynthetic enzyme [Diaporthe eres]|uniref:Secondary metabolism biosynthetic enzyme n=1 Tax=Diaporthe eres TaxID=83184 RepID=A0ABR1NP96_DIAER